MIGGAGKKISKMVDLAEELYERVNELRSRVESMSATVDATADRVETLETELAEQRALVAAIAEEQGVDVEAVAESARAEETGQTGGSEAADAETQGASDRAAE